MSTDIPRENCLTTRQNGFRNLLAITAGEIALHKITAAHSGQVRGVTSKGIFLDLDNGWVIFATPGLHKGPLTVNIPALSLASSPLKIGDHFDIHESTLTFVQAPLRIIISQAQSWSLKTEKISTNPDMAMRISRKLGDFLSLLQSASSRSNPYLAHVIQDDSIQRAIFPQDTCLQAIQSMVEVISDRGSPFLSKFASPDPGFRSRLNAFR